MNMSITLKRNADTLIESNYSFSLISINNLTSLYLRNTIPVGHSDISKLLS